MLAATDGLRPNDTYVFFTGNDLCARAIAFVETGEDYAQSLRRGLKYIIRNGQSAGPSRVHVVGFLGVLQLLHADSILQKKVKAFGEELSCQQLREKLAAPENWFDPKLPPEAWYFSMLMPPNPVRMCPTLFGRDPGNQDSIAVLATRIREFRRRQREVVDALNAAPQDQGNQIHFSYLEETTRLSFDGDDIAEDCFHLSIRGQSKVAEAVLRDLGR